MNKFVHLCIHSDSVYRHHSIFHTLGYRQGFMHCQEISITLCIYPLQMELYTTEKNRTSCALHTLCFCIYVLLAIYYVHVYFL